jgi:hypothetical protein
MPELAQEQAIEGGSAGAEALQRDTEATQHTKTDEELVGLEPEPYRGEYRDARESNAEAADSEATHDVEDEALRADEEATTTQLMPESFKKAIAAAPEVKAELQRLWDEHQAFREVFPTAAEARAVKELFPEGAEQAKAALSKAIELEQSDALFASRDPRLQRELAANMLAFDPQAFGAMLQVGAELVRERSPELYRAFVASLTGPGDEANASRAAVPIKSTPSTANAREEYLERQLNSMTEQQGAAFSVSVNQSVMPQVDAEIRKLIEPVTRGLPAYAREGATQSLAGEIHGEVERRLRSDLHYHGQLASIQAGLQYGVKNHDAVTKVIVSRVLHHLKPVAKQVLQGWTPRHIEQGREIAKKAENAAHRTDLSGGGLTNGRRSAKLTRDEARELTDDQLMDWAFRR